VGTRVATPSRWDETPAGGVANVVYTPKRGCLRLDETPATVTDRVPFGAPTPVGGIDLTTPTPSTNDSLCLGIHLLRLAICRDVRMPFHKDCFYNGWKIGKIGFCLLITCQPLFNFSSLLVIVIQKILIPLLIFRSSPHLFTLQV